MNMWKIISLVLLLTLCKSCARRDCDGENEGDHRFVSLSNNNIRFHLEKEASVYVSEHRNLEDNIISISLKLTSVKLFKDDQLIVSRNGSYGDLDFLIWYENLTLHVANASGDIIISHNLKKMKYFAYNRSIIVSCFHEEEGLTEIVSQNDYTTNQEEFEPTTDVESTYHSPTTRYVSDEPTNCTCSIVPCACANNLNESLVYNCVTWSCNCSYDSYELNVNSEECNCTAIECETCQSFICGIVNEMTTETFVESQTKPRTRYNDDTFTERNRNTDYNEVTSDNQNIVEGSTESGEYTSISSSQMQTNSSQTGSDGYSEYKNAVLKSTTASAINKEGGGIKYSTTVLILMILTGALVLAFVIGCICAVAGLIRKPRENKDNIR